MTDTKTKIPNPLYAAAGAGELAYQQLRKLPAKVAELRDRASSSEFDGRVREVAQRNLAAVRSRAQVAQEKAAALYTDLVARGEQVVRGGARTSKDAVAEIEATAAHDAE